VLVELSIILFGLSTHSLVQGSLIFCTGREVVILKFEFFFRSLWPARNLLSLFDLLVEARVEKLIKSTQIDITFERRIDVLSTNAINTIMNKGKIRRCQSISGIYLPCCHCHDAIMRGYCRQNVKHKTLVTQKQRTLHTDTCHD
jgi:hypothetical protein